MEEVSRVPHWVVDFRVGVKLEVRVGLKVGLKVVVTELNHRLTLMTNHNNHQARLTFLDVSQVRPSGPYTPLVLYFVFLFGELE